MRRIAPWLGLSLLLHLAVFAILSAYVSEREYITRMELSLIVPESGAVPGDETPSGGNASVPTAPPAGTKTESLPKDAVENVTSQDLARDSETDPPPADGAIMNGNGESSTGARGEQTSAVIPPVLIRDVEPVYPDAARLQGWEGRVILEFLVDANGQTREISVVDSSGYDVLDKAAVSAARQWLYLPARLDGQTVATRLRRIIRFKLL